MRLIRLGAYVILALSAASIIFIPLALKAQESDPTKYMWRPVIGGIQVEMWKEKRFWFDEGPYICTLSFPVYREVDGALGVITAGHCNKWEKEGFLWKWVMYQPTRDDNTKIGEVEATSCPVDATLVLFNNVDPTVLHINQSNTYYLYPISGWISWNDVPSYVYSDIIFYKTGRTSDTTSGTLDAYWDEVAVPKDQWPCGVLYKAIDAEIHSEPGDSGSPTYYVSGGEAVLLGYLVGGDSAGHSLILSVDNVWDAFGVKPLTQG